MKRDRTSRSAAALGARGFPVRPGRGKPSGAARALLAVTVLLVLFGLLSVYSASVYIAQRSGRTDTYFLFQQASRAGVGILALLGAVLVDYRVYRRLAWPILGVTILLLLAVVLPGTEAIAPRVNGARRWIDLGVTVQPSELAKVAVVIWAAALAAKKEDLLHDFRAGLLPFLVVLAPVCLLVLLQPHFSAAAWIAVLAGTVLFAAGARLRHFAALAGSVLVLGAAQVLAADYRLRRWAAFLDPQTAAETGGYQLRQSLIAVGSGGLAGVGFGRSTTKMHFLPEPQNDFIFSVIAEEWGFLGAVFLIAAFVVWTLLGFRIARSAPDTFGRLLATGLTASVALAAVAHVGIAVGLLPTTGVNLPFISAGGTSLVLALGTTGILLNISRAGGA
ncbi:MAG: putative peptidoglycan glycosyltransferase FtsW [Gemmatimonadota bacterium]|nr:putative peptidoglycan glycosyltransferase FtsW [Gemmatimonadota bacterium]